jgi:S-adenosylmethionine uptake transporter
LGLAELTTIYYVAPAITVVLSVFILKEAVGLRSWVAVIMGLAGVAVAAKPGGNVPLVPALLVLAAAVCWAFSAVLGRLISRSESTASQMIVANGAFALCCGFAMLWVWRTPSATDLGLMAAVGVAGGLAQLAMFEGYRYAPASLTAPTEYTSFVCSFLLAYAIWSEVPSAHVWAGAVLIAGSGLALLWFKRPSYGGR